MKKILASLFLLVHVLCLVGCEKAHIDPKDAIVIDGKYYAEVIYNNPLLSHREFSRKITIENNKIQECEFLEYELKGEFFAFVSEAHIDIFEPIMNIEKIWFAEIMQPEDIDREIGFYLTLANSNFYLYYGSYKDNRGYIINSAYKLIRLDMSKYDCEKEENNFNNDIHNIVDLNTSSKAKMTYFFDDKIEKINDSTSTFYLAKLDYSEYYILCGYVKEELYIPERLRHNDYYDKIIWKDYKKDEKIEYCYDDMILSDVYLILDITIMQDVIKNEKIEKVYKYYENICDEYLEKDDYSSCFKNKNLLLWADKNITEKENLYFSEYDYELSYEIVYDDNFEMYIIFDKQYVYGNDITFVLDKQLGSYYQNLEPYLINDNSLSENIQYNNGYYTIEKTKINIVEILRLIDGGEQ